MAGYIGTQAVSVNTTSATISDDLTVGDDVLLTSDAAVLKIGADADLQLTHSGSVGTITNGTGNLTLDVAGDIILDADGGDLKFHDGGTHIGSIYNDSTNLAIYSKVNNAEMRFIGVDGGSDVTALTFDMAAEGNAHFNRSIGVGFAALPTGSNFDSLRLGGAGFFMSNSNTDASGINAMAHNAQYDADNSWEYIATDEAEYYYQSSGTHRFLSAASGTAGNDITWVDRVEFEADGDVRIYDGNLVVANGHGIDFASTGGPTNGSGESELLDDYETGTFTMTLGQVSASAFGVGRYVKIGRMVHFQWYSAGTINVDEGAGTATIAGLPFLTDDDSNSYSSFLASHNTYCPTANTGYLATNDTVGVFTALNSTANAVVNASTGRYLMITGSYRSKV
jgi:hypothetical protein